MVSITLSSALLFASYLTNVALGHPGHDPHDEIAQRSQFFATNEFTSLSHCAGQLKAREAARVARRHETINRLRRKRSIAQRDIEDVLAKDHKSNLTVTQDYPHNYVFAANNSCILSPEVTEGPYYVSGEYVRKDLREGEEGVTLYLDTEIINMLDCEPLSDVALEIWASNSTGVYGGVVVEGNGNVNDLTNINNTALRGIQFSGADGVVEFETLFPGHYTGRTTHVHVLAHINSTIRNNHTLAGGTVSHVGQVYFDQALITAVEATDIYSTNTQPLTTNADDFRLAQGAEGEVDPIVNYVLLDDEDVTQGIFAWITFGIDPTFVRTVRTAVNYGENGGVANPVSGSTPTTPTPTPTPTAV